MVRAVVEYVLMLVIVRNLDTKRILRWLYGGGKDFHAQRIPKMQFCHLAHHPFDNPGALTGYDLFQKVWLTAISDVETKRAVNLNSYIVNSVKTQRF